MTSTKHSTTPPHAPSVTHASASASDWDTLSTMSASTARPARPAASVTLPFTLRRARTTTQGLRSIGRSSRAIAQFHAARSGCRYRVRVAADSRVPGLRSLTSSRETNASIWLDESESAGAEWTSSHSCPARCRSVIRPSRRRRQEAGVVQVVLDGDEIVAGQLERQALVASAVPG